MDREIIEFINEVGRYWGVWEMVKALSSGNQEKIAEITEISERLGGSFVKLFKRHYDENMSEYDSSIKLIKRLTTQKNEKDSEFYGKMVFAFYASNGLEDFDKMAWLLSSYWFEQGFVQFAGEEFEEIVRPRMRTRITGSADYLEEKHIDGFFDEENEEFGWMRLPKGIWLWGDISEDDRDKMLQTKDELEESMFLAVKELLTENLIRNPA